VHPEARFAKSGTVVVSRAASSATFALNSAECFVRLFFMVCS
jgi:hypothetical protein